MIDTKLIICAIGSIVAHIALERGLEHLPRHVDKPLPQKIDVRVIEPPVEPPPEPPKPEEKPPEPKPQVAEVPRARPIHAPTVSAVPRDTPPPENAPVTNDTTDTPTFGVSMESTSTGGSGPMMPVGNTTRAQPGAGSAAPAKPLAEPVAAFEATKMPLPKGQCYGKFTEEALAAGDQGSVVIDLIVDETGRARDIKVVSGLPHGLTEAAVAALKACHFSPGEKDGKAVPVKIRGFKITFVPPDDTN